MERQAQGFSKSFMAGFAGIGASIGGLVALQSVVTFFKDSAQAAMDDQKSMVALAQAMDNVGLSAQNAKAEGLIESMMLQTGIADDKLRPAFQKLVTATQDVGKAQGLLQTALDLSAAGYGDLESASKALSAAAMGNFTALQRLKVPIDANIIKTKDFQGAIEALNGVVGGQAAAAANTYAGQMSRISVAAGEAQEAIGYALMDALDRVINKMGGGASGMQGVILQTGDTLAAFIDDVAGTTLAIGDLTGMLVELGSFGLVKAKSGLFDLGSWFKAFVDTVLQFLGGPAVAFYKFLVDVGLVSDDAAGSTEDLALANEHGARASMQAAKGLSGLGDDTEDAGAKAWEAAKGYYAFYSTLAQGAQVARDLANTSGDVAAGIAEGFSGKWLKGPGEFVKQYGEAKKAVDGLGSSAGGAGKAAEDLAIKWKAAAASITADVDALTITMGGGGEVIAGAMTQAFQDRLAAFKGVVDAQVGIITQARQALDQYSQSITDSVMGKINFSTVDPTTGEPMTPQQIMQMILGDITNQTNAVTAIAGIATQLPPALTAQIIALPPDAAIALANYLAANPALVEQLTANFNALATATKTLLGDPMAVAFATIGNRSAVSMIADAKAKIGESAESFQNFVKSKLNTDITVRVHWAADDPPKPNGRAMGGSVSAGVPVLVGERGMEMFVPSVDGSIIPNHDLSMAGASAGGNTYQITVQAGVGDPRAIGKTVVEAITLFERSSGPVFARA
jgi:hypothetical protein